MDWEKVFGEILLGIGDLIGNLFPNLMENPSTTCLTLLKIENE